MGFFIYIFLFLNLPLLRTIDYHGSSNDVCKIVVGPKKLNLIHLKRDILTRADIELLVDTFYSKIKQDQVIGYIFSEVAQLDFDHHLPIMYRFWETTLLGALSYKGNPMTVHMQLDQKEKLTKAHFDRWLQLFSETLDELFEGKVASEAKNRASQIAHLMLYKIEQIR